jgi:hypothetical protein
LSTSNFREAEHLARVLDRVFDTFFRDEPQVIDIKAILRDQLKAALEADRQQHLDTPPRKPVYALWADRYEDPVEADLEAVQGVLHDYRQDLAMRDISSIREELEEVMAARGVPNSQRVELGPGLLQVQIEALEQSLKNLMGGVVGHHRSSSELR